MLDSLVNFEKYPQFSILEVSGGNIGDALKLWGTLKYTEPWEEDMKMEIMQTTLEKTSYKIEGRDVSAPSREIGPEELLGA